MLEEQNNSQEGGKEHGGKAAADGGKGSEEMGEKVKSRSHRGLGCG